MKKLLNITYPSYFILFCILLFGSCKKSNSQQILHLLPEAQGTVLQLQVDDKHPGFFIAPDYLGLSFEMSAITDSNYFNTSSTSFVELIKNLSPGILRIGANAVDKTFWTGQKRTALTPKDSITTTDIDRFKFFINAIQWKVIFGLNCGGKFNPAIAAQEAAYVNSALPLLLQSFEVGNEADLYSRNGMRSTSYKINDFINEWGQYYLAVKNSVPGANFSGGAFAYNQQWLSTFVGQESSKINLATIHFYQTGPGTDPSITINSLLSAKADSAISKFADAIALIASGVQLPYRIAECNSIYGGGKGDVSNTFAAALWAIDYQFRLAYSGCKGINFHGGNNGPYTPIGYANGLFFAKPEYYSMLFFKEAAKGNLLPNSLQNLGLNVTTYASKASDGTTYISILNKEAQTAVSINVQTGITAQTVTLAPLTAPGLSSATGLMFAGKQLQDNGQLTSGLLDIYTVNANHFTVNVPAASAMLVTIHP